MTRIKLLIATTAAVLYLAIPSIVQGGQRSAAQGTAAHGTKAEPGAAAAIGGSQASADADRQRQEAQRDAKKALDKDAMIAIEETRKATKAIASGDTPAALAAIERATGKVDILVARKPASALLPVDFEVEIVDAAPRDGKDLDKLARQAEAAVDDGDYPRARLLLEGLASELRLRTYHLPLATYPDAMRAAAHLLEQKKNQEAANVLQTALDTLVVTEERTPLPLLIAKGAIDQAQAQRESDKETARQLLANAKAAVERAQRLGYAREAAEYESLRVSIAKLDEQLTGTENTDSAFSSLKTRLSEFLGRLSIGTRGASSSETAGR